MLRENHRAYNCKLYKNISSDLLTVESLSKIFAMSSSTLLRRVKKLTGLTPLMYLKEHRLNHAREFLESRTYKSISTVVHKVGYSNNASFSRAFKSRFGITPKEIYLD